MNLLIFKIEIFKNFIHIKIQFFIYNFFKIKAAKSSILPVNF